MDGSGFRIVVTNTLAYYDTTTITSVKSFIVQAPGLVDDVIYKKGPVANTINIVLSVANTINIVVT